MGIFLFKSRSYIREIISSNDNPLAIQWYVSIFSEADKTKALDTLLPLSIPVDNIHFKTMSDFVKKNNSTYGK